MTYVLDTNIINWLIDRKLDNEALPSDSKFVATHIQIDEINNTADAERRSRLFLTLASSLNDLLQTETTVFGISRFNFSKFGNGLIYGSVKSQLDSLNGGKASNIRDALIAEVAIVNGHTLLTADRDLARVAADHGGIVRLFEI